MSSLVCAQTLNAFNKKVLLLRPKLLTIDLRLNISNIFLNIFWSLELTTARAYGHFNGHSKKR